VSIQLIVGLGNPGRSYEKTRHNAGFWFVQALAEQFVLEQPLKLDKKYHGLVGAITVDSKKYFLLQPQTYMNESGISISTFINFYKIPPTNILVAHDELDFPPGKTCLKFGGGHGGHNGLRNIIQHIGADFWRLRIGIGHPKHKDLVHDYVLNKPSLDQKKQMEDSIQQVIPLVPRLLSGDFEQVMCELHTQSN
jgi:PTH1 family peptidyl-tRNA hydrolase